MSSLRPVVTLALATLVSLPMSCRLLADEITLKADAKVVGQEAGAAVRKVGEAGKEVGQKVVETAREVGHATRDGAREFKKAVKGETAAKSGATRQQSNSKRPTSDNIEAKPADTTIANK